MPGIGAALPPAGDCAVGGTIGIIAGGAVIGVGDMTAGGVAGFGLAVDGTIGITGAPAPLLLAAPLVCDGSSLHAAPMYAMTSTSPLRAFEPLAFRVGVNATLIMAQILLCNPTYDGCCNSQL